MAISSAIGSERRSRVSGYKIQKGFFDNVTSNLPQIIAVFGEANTANQASLSTNKREITSAQEAGDLYGYGSPIHNQMRILRPASGAGVGGIPTIVFPQAEASGATVTTIVWTVTGTATGNATHTAVISGRRSVDFAPYSYSIVSGDTPTAIATKITTAINSVLGSPVSATSALGVITLTTKWKGITSDQVTSKFDNNESAVGVTYAQTSRTAGAGVTSISAALNQFGNDWYTIVTNPYGEEKFTDLEQFNGIPDPDNPTGRYEGITFRPFVSLFGSTLSSRTAITAITDAAARIEQVTNVLCPAPNSEAMPWEAAANCARLFARTMQDSPHLDISNRSYPDMPIPDNSIIGDMSDYENRDFLIKRGASTVVLENAAYVVQDFVTTYHPAGENPLQFNYARNLIIDWNFSDGYRILENRNVKDHVIVLDDQITDATNAVKPKNWRAILHDYINDLAVRALIKDPEFSIDSLNVQIDPNNPNRFNTFLRYRRTGIARIQSTDVEVGF